MTDKPSVLFVCVHNAGRSQMAAGFLTALAGDRVDVRSAGSMPGDKINPVAVEAMADLLAKTGGSGTSTHTGAAATDRLAAHLLGLAVS